MENLSRNIENQEVKSVNRLDFDEENYEQNLKGIHEEDIEEKKQREPKLENLMSELSDENGSEKEKNRLNQLHEAILKLDISSKNNEGYKTLGEILDDSNKTTEKKLELMVKIVHSMDGNIDLQYRDNKTERISFYC